MSSSDDTDAIGELSKPTHWRELVQGDRSQSGGENPRFFRFLMSISITAEEIASSETAMEGVFSYDE